MSKVRLDGAGVLTISGQLEAAPVSQHVAVDEKAKPGGLAGTSDHPLIARYAERCPTL
jgi:hypothetical protein